MEEDDLESTVESIISAIAYAFESIRQWDRAVLGGRRSREPAGLG